MPKRIQRKRTKGWRMPENTVYVGRPTRWGNPADWQKNGRAWAVEDYRRQLRNWQGDDAQGYYDMLKPLQGKDLACWCPLDQPCHADVLLELANPDSQRKIQRRRELAAFEAGRHVGKTYGELDY
jgi:hypothetical protein